MSRHYHDSECAPSALESIDERLGELVDLMERIAQRLDPPVPDVMGDWERAGELDWAAAQALQSKTVTK
jgi:hypothetical protein